MSTRAACRCEVPGDFSKNAQTCARCFGDYDADALRRRLAYLDSVCDHLSREIRRRDDERRALLISKREAP